jgi:superfamily II DNA or RNA helicase
VSDLKIRKVNEATLRIECSNSIARELTEYFSAFSDNYRFHPKYKAKQWDGKLRFFTWENTLPIGLLYKVKEFCAKGRYTLEQLYEQGETVPYSEYLAFVDSLNIDVRDEHNNSVPVRDYQLKAAYEAICEKHLNMASSTASGKSLIIYIIIRWLVSKGKRCLCIFPTTILVEQIFSDFADYGWEDVENNCCMIYSGKKRLLERNIIFSTWQSLYTDKDKDEIAKFDCLLVDEAHGQSGNSKSFAAISKNCINAEYRFGLSGSFPDPLTADWFTTVGATGEIRTYSTYKTLQDAGHISQLKIYAVRLKYPNSLRYLNYETNIQDATDTDEDFDDELETTTPRENKYAKETDFVNKLECRNKFIVKLVQKLKGNTLVLFTKIEAHGKPLFERLRAEVTGKMVMYIDGSVSVADRKLIKARMETNDECVLAATYSTLSTGVNIKRIHNIIFVSGTKSKVRTIQSIGRGLRKHITKDFMKLFDLVDDLSFKDSNKKIRYVNFAVKHYGERLKIYRKNEFTIETLEYELKE